jgi:hypothetical protein
VLRVKTLMDYLKMHLVQYIPVRHVKLIDLFGISSPNDVCTAAEIVSP